MLCLDVYLEITIYGVGSNIRKWIYADDNCRPTETVRKNGDVDAVYNIGNGDERTNLEASHEVLDAVGADAYLIEFVEDRSGHDQRYALDSFDI